MSGKLKQLRSQRGFTMVEVVMATLIFTASVVGISGMLISGSANVTRGAKETAAINLANRRLEEVKSLPFYIPWDPAKGNQDIDDYYYNVNKANGVAGDEGKHPQLDNPSVTEDYGSIPGFTDYKRTTAIEYQYVSTVGGTSHLAPAVMSTTSPYSWVPKSPSDESGETDDPRGGASEAATDEVHALVVEVSVYYNLGDGERVYKERTLVGALTTSGAFNQPYLLIQSINPNTGDYGDTSFSMTIYVKASNEFNGSSTVDVRLWRTGAYDIPATSSTVSADGTRVTSYFDLSDPKIVLNQSYNISVYWKEGGWKDEFRSCFMMVQVPPSITGLTNADGTTQAWGYEKQSAKQVIVEGDHLGSPTSVVLKDPNSSAQINGTVVNVPGVTDSHTIVANFNLATATSPNKYWNVMVTSAGGNDTSASDAERLLVNPPPKITGVTATDAGSDPPGWFDWAFASQTARKVRIEGQYLYGLDQQADTSTTLWYGGSQIANAVYVAAYPPAPATQNPVNPNDFKIDTQVVMAFNLNAFLAAKSVRSTAPDGVPCDVRITNYGGADTQSVGNRVKVNPLPVITGVTPTPTTQGSVKYFDWAFGAQSARNVRIEGNYLYGLDQQADTSTTLWYSGSQLAASTYVTGLAPGTQTTVNPNDFEADTQVVMAFNFSAFSNAKSVRDPTNKPNGVPCDIQIVTYGNIGGAPAASGNDSSRVRLNPRPVIDGITATNISASPNYFSWAHGAESARNVRVVGHYLYGLDESLSDYSARLIPPSPNNADSSKWTDKAVVTSGQWAPQTQDAWDNEWDETRPVVLTFNPSSNAFTKTTPNANWNVRIRNYGCDSSTAAVSASGVLMNPTPVITGVSATSASGSPPYFNWAHAAETARNVRIEGNYLYALDQSDTTVQLEYGGNRTSKATFTPPQNPALYDVYTDTPVVMTFNPSSASGVKTASNTKWNVEVTNYGGTAKSNGVATKQVWMNPPPVITGVTATSSPNYYNWAYLSQASRNVRVEGQYLYGLDQAADSQVSATLRYNPGTLYETATEATSADPDPTVHDTDINAPAILTFHPSSAAPAPPVSTYNKYWDVRIQNYGGSDTSTADSERVYMNPLPTVSTIKVYNTSTSAYDTFSTAKTGTASDTNYKAGEVYQNVAINGTYLQPGSSINLARNTFTPTSGVTYVPLTGGTVAADGTSITGLTMDVDVNPMNTSSFMQWPGSTLQSDNTLIAGTYHLIFVNSDGTKAAQDKTLSVTHATFTVTATSKQTTWGGVSPASASYYQDQTATVTATPTTSSPAGRYQFVAWQSGGTDFSTDNPITFTDSATHTIQARFLMKLYWSTDGTTNANWASFVKGYDSGTGTTFTPMDTGESLINPSMYIYASGGYNREIAGVTTSTVNLTGASKLWIDWKQVNASNSYLVVSTNKTSGYNTYNTHLAYPSQAFAERSESLDVSGYQSSYYIRVHSRTPSSTTNTSTIRVYRVWLE